jgi:hypothetical protein
MVMPPVLYKPALVAHVDQPFAVQVEVLMISLAEVPKLVQLPVKPVRAVFHCPLAMQGVLALGSGAAL